MRTLFCPKCEKGTQDLVDVGYKDFLCPKCCIRYREEESNIIHEFYISWFGTERTCCQCHKK